MLPPKIQNIKKKKKTRFGRQSNDYSFECIIYDITKEYPDGHTIQLEIWLDFRREVFTSNSSPFYTSIPVQQCTIFISIVNERNPIQINIEKNNFSLMYYMGLLSGTNLFGIQDAMSLYSLCIGSIFRIHLKVAMSFRLLSNHDCLDPIFS